MMTNEQIELRARAFELYSAPFKYQYGYIFDANHKTFADTGDMRECEARIRGWGHIQKHADPEALQDAVGELFAEALTEFWLAAKQDAAQNKQNEV